jgi:two-component sensor histidine kinase
MLLRMQMRTATDINPRETLQEAINRIQSIAAVHEVLSERGFRRVDILDLLGRVARGVVQSMAHSGLELALHIDGPTFDLPSQPATSLALVINELVQNAVEHAFEGRRQGNIWIELDHEPARWVIRVRDDGSGLTTNPDKHMGLKIVETLVREDLRGEFSLTSGAGAIATLRMPRS